MAKERLAKPVALVTGGAKRLGRAISEYLASHGFIIAVHYNNSKQDAENLCHEIASKGGTALPFQADLLSDNPAFLLQRVKAEFGSVNLLVNNASLFIPDALPSLDPIVWAKHFKIHAEIPIFLAQALARDFMTSKKNKISTLIINIADERVLRLNPQCFSYTLSKSVLWTATQTMAQALAPHIRVNAIGPGPSFKNERQTEAEFAEQCLTLPLKHGPEPEEFGRTICYLWETPSVTGQIVALDGGQHLMWQTPDLQWDKSGAES